MERLDLARPRAGWCRTLSGGQRRRLDIAHGARPRARLLFLDEPSTGLDPQSRANLWEHIRGLHAEHGTTLFLTTHYLDEADALCDRILVIDQGRIVAEGTPDALKRRVSGDLVLVGAGEPRRVAAIAGGARAGQRARRRRRSARFRVPDARERRSPACSASSTRRACAMTSVEVRRPSLDDVFLTLTGRTLRDAEQKVSA